MRVEILPPALEDLSAGREFYEKQSPGLGTYFLDSLFSEIESLADFGGIHPIIYGSHRAIARRFPYAIYYEVREDVVHVQAVYDCRRHPGKIRRRLEGK
jgi:plasmid stabilization system protein ParE